MKKIYFAGSIRGGRDDAALYARLIAHMQEKHRVLTEHVGSPGLEAGERDMTDAQIFARDTAWLRESDLVIAECTTPSLGVGYELAYAERLGKPVHVFFDRRRGALSAMISGDPSFHIHPYAGEDELFTALDTLL